MGQIISSIKKSLLGQFFYYIRKCLCRQREEKRDSSERNGLHISTPEQLDPLSYSKTDSCFKLHQNVSTTCFDPQEENRQESEHVLNVDNLEERDVCDPEIWIRHYCSSHKTLSLTEVFGSDPSTDCETDSSFRLRQSISPTCSDPAEDNGQDSAYVLDVDNLAESDDPERWIRDYCSSHKTLLVADGDFSLSASLARAFYSDPSSDSLADSSFRLHQNVSTTCFDVGNRQDNSAYVLNVENWEESDVLRSPKRWIRHYCSSHKILLVGEGDFSFSASLATAFGSATNMVATSLDSTGFLLRNYKNAISNIQELKTRGCMVLHGVDATEMANHYYLGDRKFDRVIYNFPHAGFRSGESGVSQIRRHQLLISLFFKNAKEMINENGEIHVRHKSNHFFLAWNLPGLASAVGLRLREEVPFNFTDYPGYRTKYGFGGDKNFNCNPSKTYIFGLFPAISS